ncbi:MAG: polymer-forming cytoskeletal protein, partial [Chloroflexi bacterium]|nr:polymer-forming cytoskeletal protein [Chloroflexota bacterium]
MHTRFARTPFANIFLAALLALSASLALFSTAHAQGIVYGDRVPVGTIVANDVILYGETVIIDGTVEGDVLAIATTVEVNGTITGALVSAGQSVRVSGNVGGSIYAASLLLGLGPRASIGRGVYFLGGELDTAQGSTIQRDISAVALGARLDGDLGRNMNAIIGPVELFKLAVQGINGLLGTNRIQLPPLLEPTSAAPSPAPVGAIVPRLQSMGPSAAALGLPEGA